MSDPSDRHRADPHPSSAHRTPDDIAEDEAGPIGDPSHPRGRKPPADPGPVRKLDEREVPKPGSTPGGKPKP